MKGVRKKEGRNKECKEGAKKVRVEEGTKQGGREEREGERE